MAKRRGNSSSYNHKSNKADRLEEVWRMERTRPTIRATYDKLQSPQFADLSVKGYDVAVAIDFLAEATDDEVFWAASLALRAYGLDKGGLKASTLRMLRNNNRTAEWAAMEVMDQFRCDGTSVLQAARLTAALLGLESHSFASITGNLRKLYPKWLKAGKTHAPPLPTPDGSTGRKLKVRLRQVVKNGDRTSRISSFPGDAVVDTDGFAIVPDNREWRRLVNRGFAVFYGVTEQAVGKILEEKDQDAR